MLHLASNMRQLGHLARGVYTPSATGPFGGHATLATGLVAYYKLNETSGTTAEDSHTGNLDGTNTGATVNQDGAYKFVDSTDFVDFGTFSALWDDTNNKATFDFLFKATDVSAAQHMIIARFSNSSSDARDRYFYVTVLATGEVRVWIGDEGGANNYDYWTTDAAHITSDDTFYYIACAIDLSANTCVIYVNADAKANTKTSSGSDVTVFEAGSTITYKIGRIRNSDGSYTGMTNGYVREHGIWNKVLTSTEVSDRYNGGTILSY